MKGFVTLIYNSESGREIVRVVNSDRIFHFTIEESEDGRDQTLVITMDNDREIKCKLPREVYSDIGEKNWKEFKRVFMYSLSGVFVCNEALINVNLRYIDECVRFLRKPLDI